MYYFESIKEQKLLKGILESWIGTPFRHHCGVKGFGCDCIHFVARVSEEAGMLKWGKSLIPDYPKDWHIHNTRELLEEGVLRELNVEKVQLFELRNGDIILSHCGKAASHAAIYSDGYVYQALNKVGVCKINFTDVSFRKRMKVAYRVMSA